MYNVLMILSGVLAVVMLIELIRPFLLVRFSSGRLYRKMVMLVALASVAFSFTMAKITKKPQIFEKFSAVARVDGNSIIV